MKAQRRTGVNGERVNCRVQLIRVVPPKLSVPFRGKEGFGVFCYTEILSQYCNSLGI